MKLQPPGKRGHVTIALLDAGFRTSHKSIRDYLRMNTSEISDNQVDDDHNGYPDDILGWDVADEDNNVIIPRGKEDAFYHGTYIASIIASTVEAILGPDAARHVSIIPVKIISDNAGTNQLRDAYKGFLYARSIGADLVCCAWAGGRISEQELAAVRAMVQDGKGIIAAAGNFMTERVETPASITGVTAVAALDPMLRKTDRSNYGMRIDLSAPGSEIYGAHPDADNAFIRESGTSAATAIVTGIMAALKVLSPGSGSMEIREALRNTSRPIDHLNLTYAGKLGAGIPDVEKALTYLRSPSNRSASFDGMRPEGTILPLRGTRSFQWQIRPSGNYLGLHLSASMMDDRSNVTVRNADSIVFRGTTAELNRVDYLPGSSFIIEYERVGSSNKGQSFNYSMETIDSTRLFCSGKQVLNIRDEGFIEDGSGPSDYANRCDCSWQLIAPEGRRIRIEAIVMNTEPLMDYIWFFEGSSTIEEDIIAKFSGSAPPPVIETRGNKLLIWFVTDKVRTGKGWKLRYRVID